MFKFSFNIDDEDDTVVVAPSADKATSAASSNTPRAPPQPNKRISLTDLLATLPENFSYSPLAHPLGGAPLLRRDLYDARFQLAQGEAASEAYVDADTDLIPGTYEGGLKSWEGGVDLVEVIARGVVGPSGKGKRAAGSEEVDVGKWVRGARVLEVGCGTGLPSAYLLRSLLASPEPSTTRTTLHLQDYNLPVLSLVTLPNLVLAALPSLPASARAAAETAADEDEEDDEDDEAPRRPFDPTRAGTLDVTPALVDAFTALLKERGIDLVFTYGDWSGMAVDLAGEAKYNLVLTAETIYAEESVGPLIDVLRGSVAPGAAKAKPVALEDSLEALSVGDWSKEPLVVSDPVILVAAKVLYFGVGGGLDSFVARVEELGGWTTRVHDWVRGVGRAVVRIGW